MSAFLREAIRTSGKTCYQLARETGVSKQAISLFMNGGNIRLDKANRLCHAVGLKLVASGRKR